MVLNDLKAKVLMMDGPDNFIRNVESQHQNSKVIQQLIEQLKKSTGLGPSEESEGLPVLS